MTNKQDILPQQYIHISLTNLTVAQCGIGKVSMATKLGYAINNESMATKLV
jgi:hypothetical protein